MYYLYLLKCRDGTIYTGITTDVNRRVEEHNNSKLGAKYTRGRRPVKLLFKMALVNRSEALKAESEWKKLNHGQKLERIREKLG
jgi:putative endonuclease